MTGKNKLTCKSLKKLISSNKLSIRINVEKIKKIFKIFFTSKENKKFNFYRYIIFFSGMVVIVVSEISLRYSSNSILGL
jgi:hypothetical protein